MLLNYVLVSARLASLELCDPGASWAILLVMLFLRTLGATKLYRQFGRPHLSCILETPALGRPLALNIGVEFGLYAIVLLLTAHVGVAVLGARAVAIRINSVAFMAPLCVAQPLAILVSQANNSGDSEGARRIC